MNYLYSILFIVLSICTQTNLWAQKRVACIGDSVTKGYGIKDSTKSYPFQLQQLLGTDFVVGNFGHSGATLLQRGHNPYIKTQAYKDALAFRPDIIVIALGLNDTDPRNWPNYGAEFFDNYVQLITDFKKINPQVEVYICMMTPIFSGHPRFLSGTRDWYDQIQALIPEIAAVTQSKLIDNHLVLAARIDLFEDNLHPSAQGANLIATNVFAHLVPAKRSLRIDKTIGNHMVLQRHSRNTIKGKASANETITLNFNAAVYKTVANQLGDWRIDLPAMKAGGPYTLAIATAKDSLLLEDIMFGDVYLASGQSNMAFQLQAMQHAQSYMDHVAKHSSIRIFKNNNLVETNPTAWDSITLQKINDLQFFSGNWEVPNATNIKDFSAIAYVFASDLNTSLEVPIGIIDLSVGGSNTESWIDRKTLENDNLLASYIHNWRNSDFVQDFCKQRASKNLEASKGKYQRHPYDPSYNFEAGLQKWLDTQLKAVLWYQGESNAHNIEHHNYLFESLLLSWRNAFKQDLPFYVVQLSSINRPSWGAFRDAQRLLSINLPKVYMAVSSDVGDVSDVHPKEKEVIGKRLAALAKQNEYKMPIQAGTPSPIAVKRANGFVTITFNNCKSLKLVSGEKVKDFKVVNTLGQVVQIEDIKINKNKVHFQEPVSGIRSVQYGFTSFTDGNLISDSDVPVSTFNIKIK